MNEYAYKEIVLVDRSGKETRLPAIMRRSLLANAWIFHDGKWWGFGVGKLDGSAHFYEASPTGEQIQAQ